MSNSRGGLGKIIALGFYSAGIIVGGGILALPLVATDTGGVMLFLLLIIFAAIFYIIYNRIIDSVSLQIVGKQILKPGLLLYDEGIRGSGLVKFGRLAFTVGLVLYVIPADIVYILYGFKSILQLSSNLAGEIDFIIILIGFATFLLTLASFFYISRRAVVLVGGPLNLLLKIMMMTAIWLMSIGSISFLARETLSVIFYGVFSFAFSLAVGEFFPEVFWRGIIRIDHDDGLLPTHLAGAYLSVFKIILITLTPSLAFIIVLSRNALAKSIPLLPRSVEGLFASISVIIFMYVGSGVYNILVYRWVCNNLKLGKKIVSLAILISLISYIIFSTTILLAVDPSILINSSLEREHAFIALARKLEAIGISSLGLAIVIVANMFALVSVSVAFLGFTDTLSDRLELDLGVDRDTVWLVLTLLVTLIVVLLEAFDITRIATDALGIAGNAGGGLFILILPWLLKGKDGKRNIGLASAFLILVTTLNLFMIANSLTIVSLLASILATLLVLIFGILVIDEARRAV